LSSADEGGTNEGIMRTRSLRLLLALALCSLALAGCKKKVGDKCNRPDQMACLDKDNALICVDSKFVQMQCRGSGGCAGAGDAVTCDNKFGQSGDGCNKETSDLACTSDKKGELRCKDNKLVLASTCRGPKGCWWESSTLHCDTDVADLTDPCEDDDDLACSSDGKSLLKCKSAKYSVENTCKGPKGCKVDGTKVHCDDDIADPGDACATEGDLACSTDKKQLLSCKSGKFKVDSACKKGCAYTEKDDKTTFDCR
jgi:hypothetical protein